MDIDFNRKLDDIEKFVKREGFYYSKEQLYNFYVSLITKPFVIISGISGSGKSKIVDLFAEYMSNAYGVKDNFELVAVKPNWTDGRGIFGYHNILDNTYSMTSTLRLFLRALENPDKPFFLVLDEMNLAKVEYYFSDFLSLIESRRYKTKIYIDSLLKILNVEDLTLSQAIVLAAINLDSNDFKQVADFRNTSIAQWWLSSRSAKHAVAQFRTELNQNRNGQSTTNGYKPDGSRLAGKAFWAEQKGDSYKLKLESEMDASTLEEYNKLKNAHESALQDIMTKHVHQDELTLHDSMKVLKTQENQEEYDSLTDGSKSYSGDQGYYVPNKLSIPLNIFVIGTVNVDDTTYMFSPKVLDRSNVIEFNKVDLYNAYGYGNPRISNNNLPESSKEVLNMEISIATLDNSILVKNKFPEVFDILIELFNLLEITNRHFGYRVINEISLYILNYCGENSSNEDGKNALDIQTLQKILPKLSGTEDELFDTLLKFLEILEKNEMERSLRKVRKMIESLNNTGYTTFIE